MCDLKGTSVSEVLVLPLRSLLRYMPLPPSLHALLDDYSFSQWNRRRL